MWLFKIEPLITSQNEKNAQSFPCSTFEEPKDIEHKITSIHEIMTYVWKQSYVTKTFNIQHFEVNRRV